MEDTHKSARSKHSGVLFRGRIALPHQTYFNQRELLMATEYKDALLACSLINQSVHLGTKNSIFPYTLLGDSMQENSEYHWIIGGVKIESFDSKSLAKRMLAQRLTQEGVIEYLFEGMLYRARPEEVEIVSDEEYQAFLEEA